MHYLVYVSQATKPMDDAELEAILDVSRKYNSEQNVTGLLIYRYSPDTKSGHFIQMLEGDKQRVRALYDKIKRDKRHHTKIVLSEGEIPDRLFGEWAMGFKNVDDKLLANLPGYVRLGEASFDVKAFSNSDTSALEFLKFFYDAP
jgi:DNA polymerase II small subunit/DNA polymerase delta subunit B